MTTRTSAVLGLAAVLLSAVPAAAQNFRKLGVSEVAVLKGGMTQWRSEQFPVTTK